MNSKSKCMIAFALVALMAGATYGQQKTIGLFDATSPDAIKRALREKDPSQATGLDQFLAALSQHQNTTFSKNARIKVVARTTLGDIISEQQRAEILANLSERKSLPEKISKLDYLVVPVITSFSDEKAGVNAPGMGIMVTSRTVKAACVYKIFNTTTGQLLTSVSIPVTVDQRGATRTGNELGLGNRPADDSQIDQAAMEAADRAATEVLNTVFPVIVGAVFGDQVTITRGEDGKVQVGQTWEIFMKGEEIIVDGVSLGFQEVKIGEIEIVTVQAKLSTGKALGKLGGEAKGAIARLKPMPMPRDGGPDQPPPR